MNTKIFYRWNAFEELNSIITDGVYDFGDWLSDNGVKYENECHIYYVLDEFGDRTGETYSVIRIESTSEELRG